MSFLFSKTQPHIRVRSALSSLFSTASSQAVGSSPVAFRAQPFSASAQNSGQQNSSFILRSPPSTALREVPTPLVFVSVGQWDPESRKGMTSMAAMLAEKGFTCLESDITLPKEGITDSDALMEHFTSTLRSDIRLAMIPFPPVIVARASGALVAQSYISSNPATAMCLIDPPPSNAAVSGLPTPLTEFDFEAKFPISIMATPSQFEILRKDGRLANEEGVEKLVVKDLDSQEAFNKLEVWLDVLGI